MNIKFEYQPTASDMVILSAHSKNEKVSLNTKCKDIKATFESAKSKTSFKASKGETFTLQNDGTTFLIVGMGDKTKFKSECLRRTFGKVFRSLRSKELNSVSIDALSFKGKFDSVSTCELIYETVLLSDYVFDKYKKTKSDNKIKNLTIFIDDKKLKAKVQKSTERVFNTCESINITRDLVNEAPNVLHSEEYAKIVEKDAKKNLKGVKVKILNKSMIKKEKMGLFLSVNAGSAKEPRLVHLSYTPKKVTKKTKHVALVGKGITFDTGGYSLKPGSSMVGMKFDMGGSATLYGAFRAAVLNNSPYKIDCVLAMTDNAVNSEATTPDSIVRGRKGITVEILNTDAEGRLILADALDYASDLGPDEIIDAATLTGACLVALGTQVCAILGNDNKLISSLKKSAAAQNEYIWELPIIDEWRDDMKSKIADLKNIGSTRYAGTATAAAFLENFIGKDIAWAHLDIAGVCDSQSHLSYCNPKGASGLMVRSVAHYLLNEK